MSKVRLISSQKKSPAIRPLNAGKAAARRAAMLLDFEDHAAFLDFSQCDQEGNIQVTRMSDCPDIAQNAGKVVFYGTFMVNSGEMELSDGKLQIRQEGSGARFLSTIRQITYSGRLARLKGQTAYAVTERAVFRLTPGGWELIEIAPGINLVQDVLAHMEFIPAISSDLKQMDAEIFTDATMNIKAGHAS